MRTRFLARIDEVDAAQWNALAPGHPFLQHEFLAALEHCGCVDARSGWQPRHLALYDDEGRLAAAAPLYLKAHSWGEFVFDFVWARAAEAQGLHYYPKVLLAIPFTPATGPRLLARPGADSGLLRGQLLEAIVALAQQRSYSSAHALFLDDDARQCCLEAGWLLRRDCHFQWHNRGYRDFDDFLQSFSADKRKKARRERRRVVEQGIEFRTLHGADLDEQLLDRVYAYHALTFARHGHTPYLNRRFFTEISATLGERLIVKLALRARQPVAAAVFFRSADTLYGRYWGAEDDFHSLHFEACYYQGIDYCIEHGLARFEPGTQGEHKLARGFEPALTWSAHWIADPVLRRAIAQYLIREATAIDAYVTQADAHVPYRKDGMAATSGADLADADLDP